MSVTIDGTTGISGVAGSASAPALVGSDADSGYYINSANEPSASVNGTAVWNAASTFGFKNRIINGNMAIDQRNAGAAVNPVTTAGPYTLDRWGTASSTSVAFSVQQVADAPSGFVNSLKVTSLTTSSLSAGSYFLIRQSVEGYNIADLGWGSASAKAVTISFWTKSSLTGTFGGTIYNSSANRTYPFSYTINAANTWEQKTITVAGDTSGTWETGNGQGLTLVFGLGIGSTFSGTANTWSSSFYYAPTGATSVVGTSGATWYVTGVQLEKGSTATSFDFRSIGTELQLCQRYFEKSFDLGTAPANSVGSLLDRRQGVAYQSTTIGYEEFFKVPKRATGGSMTFYKGLNAGTNGVWSYYDGTNWIATSGSASTTVTEVGYRVDLGVTGRTFGQALILDGNWTCSSEL